MAKWQDFTAYVDSIKGKLTPDEQRLLARTRDFNSAQGSDQVMKAAQEMIMRRTGMDQRAAMNFIMLDKNVLKHGGEDAGAAFGKEAEVGSRANYGTDEAYRSALLRSMGIDDGFVEGGQPGDATTGEDTRGISAQIQQFIDSMMGGIPENDPTSQMIRQQAVNSAQAFAGRAGMNGRSTLGGSAAADMNTRGQMAYDFQRKQAGQQGLALMSQRDLGLGQLQQGYLNMQNTLAQAKFGQDQNQAQAFGSLIGGIGGGIIGGYAGGPQGAAAGMSGGSAIGGGLFGAFSGQQGPKYQTSVPASGRGINPYTGY